MWAPARSRCAASTIRKLVDPRGRKINHGVILKVVVTNICGSDQHMVRGRTTAPAGLVSGPRNYGRGDRNRIRRRVHQGRRPRLDSIQRGLRSLPQLPGARDRSLSDGESRARRRRLRLCGYGRMDRWPGRVRHGSLRRLQLAEIPRQGAGYGEDSGSDLSHRYPADRISRLRQRRRDHGIDSSHIRRRTRRARRGRFRACC